MSILTYELRSEDGDVFEINRNTSGDELFDCLNDHWSEWINGADAVDHEEHGEWVRHYYSCDDRKFDLFAGGELVTKLTIRFAEWMAKERLDEETRRPVEREGLYAEEHDWISWDALAQDLRDIMHRYERYDDVDDSIFLG